MATSCWGTCAAIQGVSTTATLVTPKDARRSRKTSRIPEDGSMAVTFCTLRAMGTVHRPTPAPMSMTVTFGASLGSRKSRRGSGWLRRLVVGASKSWATLRHRFTICISPSAVAWTSLVAKSCQSLAQSVVMQVAP